MACTGGFDTPCSCHSMFKELQVPTATALLAIALCHRFHLSWQDPRALVRSLRLVCFLTDKA